MTSQLPPQREIFEEDSEQVRNVRDPIFGRITAREHRGWRHNPDLHLAPRSDPGMAPCVRSLTPFSNEIAEILFQHVSDTLLDIRSLLNKMEHNRITKLEAIMSKTVTLRLKEEVYEVLLEAAKAENRPLSNLIETAAMAKINEQQFADDAELAEILENREEMERIKKGSRDARSRRGRLVE
jgi:uncharacterized protein (DUF1778 family)